MIDSNHPHKHGYTTLRTEANRLLRMAEDVEKIISLVHRIYGEHGLDVLDGVSGGEKTPRDDINEWRAKAESLRKSAYVLQYGDTEEPETIQEPKVPEVEKSCFTCAHDIDKSGYRHGCGAMHLNIQGVCEYIRESGCNYTDDAMPSDRTIVCPSWKSKDAPIGSVEGP